MMKKMIPMDIPSHLVFLSWHNEMSPLPISAWRVGQGSRKRWWRRRCCERSRWCVWEARSSRRGAILQVRSSKHLLHTVSLIHWSLVSVSPSLCVNLQAKGEGTDGGTEETSFRGDRASQEGDWASTEGHQPPPGQNQKAETRWLKPRCLPTNSLVLRVFPCLFAKSMIIRYWLIYSWTSMNDTKYDINIKIKHFLFEQAACSLSTGYWFVLQMSTECLSGDICCNHVSFSFLFFWRVIIYVIKLIYIYIYHDYNIKNICFVFH